MSDLRTPMERLNDAQTHLASEPHLQRQARAVMAERWRRRMRRAFRGIYTEQARKLAHAPTASGMGQERIEAGRDHRADDRVWRTR